MLNQTGITKVSANSDKTILIAPELAFALPCKLADTGVEADAEGKKIVRAGTPIAGDMLNRETPFTVAEDVSATKGVFTLQISTAFEEDETITIEGVKYTCGETESASDKVFAGANASAQTDSLYSILSDSDKYTTTKTLGSSVITFTQKTVDASDTTGPAVSKEATTGEYSKVTSTEPVAGSNDAVGILRHDVDVTAGTANAAVVTFGFVDKSKLSDEVVAKLSSAAIEALDKKIQFVI